MGPSPSRPQNVGRNTSPTTQLNETEDFFEVGFDDIAASRTFTSPLFRADAATVVAPLQFPDADMVADVICDFTMLTSDDSRSLVWHNILCPFFQGNSQSKSQMLQLLTAYFQFVKDRSTVKFTEATNHRLTAIELSTMIAVSAFRCTGLSSITDIQSPNSHRIGFPLF
jgi:hypothetical protein